MNASGEFLTAEERRALWVLVGAGAVALGVGLAVQPVQALTSVLVSAALLTSIGTGAVLFLALHSVANAGWHTALKRVPEALTGLLVLSAISFVLLLPASPLLFSWMHAAHDPLVHAKAAYLNFPFFSLRTVGAFALWLFFAFVLVRRSRQQDADGRLEHTRAAVGWSAAFLPVGALTYSLFCTDWLMSLEPHWFSTIFGMYNIGGMLVASVAAITVVTVLLRRAGHLSAVTEAHLHDLGKLLFGFSTLWAYLWVSQFLLIWYANLPEETSHYLARMDGGWSLLFWANVVLGWALPFSMLLPRRGKRSPTNLLWAAGFLLGGRWLDLYLLAAPPSQPVHTGIGLVDVLVLLGFLAGAGLIIARGLARAPLLAQNDPYLIESLHHRA